MGLSITADLMSSDDTPHTAEPWPVPESEGPPTLWRVSWLPGRYLERDQAISAMMIAVTVGSAGPGDLRVLHIEGWAGELGLAPAEAVMMVSKPPAGTAG